MPPIPSRLPYRVLTGCVFDVLPTLPEKSVHCCVTSPPYFGLRDYGVAGQIGLEQSPEEYADKLVKVFREVKRVLRDDGTLWLNLGDSYASGPMTDAEKAGNRSGGTLNGRRGHADNVAISQRRSPVPYGFKTKDLLGIPWRVAFALQKDGWYLRSDIVWAKGVSGQKEWGDVLEGAMADAGVTPEQAARVREACDPYVGNCMPESVRDRPTKAHEYLFLLAKSARYYYDAAAIAEAFADDRMGNPKGGGNYSIGSGRNDAGALKTGVWNEDGSRTTRNRRSVWTVTPKPYKGAHFATFPPKLIEPCVLAGCPEGGTVLDPFAGAGTTLVVATKNSRRSIGVELNPEYVKLTHERMAREGLNTPIRRTQCT